MEEIKMPYISPDIEVIQFKTEKGFATSGEGEDGGYGGGL